MLNPTDSDGIANENKRSVQKDLTYFTPSTVNGVSLHGEKQDLFKPIALKVSILGNF
jgi:hypothetical protein